MSRHETRALSLSFGGVRALEKYRSGHSAGRNPRHHRAERRRQDDAPECNLRTYPAEQRRGLAGREVPCRSKTNQIAARGSGRTFQTSFLFSGMTVLQNVMAGLHQKLGANFITAAIGFGSVRAEEREAKGRALAMLDFIGMREFAGRDGGALSFGQQRLIEIARALISEPSVLLLDEPAVGLSPVRVQEMDTLLRRIRTDRGVTIVMIEHVIRLVMGACDRITVLNSGTKIAEGTGDEIIANSEVQTAYLGKAIDAAR